MLRATSTVSAVLACVLLLFLVSIGEASTARRGKVTKHHRHEHFRDHVLDLLPNIEDHAVMRELRCSACRELSAQLYETLLQLYRAKDPSHVELVEVIDNMCLHHVNMYGLLPDAVNPEKASTTLSRDSNLDLIQGLWINKFMKDRCSHLMVHHEDAIINKHPEADSLAHFQQMMCVDWDKSCDGPPATATMAKELNARVSSSKPLSKGSFSRSLRADEM
jgi:hypothetical protein